MICRKLARRSVEPESGPPKFGVLSPSTLTPRPRIVRPIRDVLAAVRAWSRAFRYMGQAGLNRYHLIGPAALAAISLVGWGFTGWLADEIRAAVLQGMTAIGLDPNTLSSSPGDWWTDVLLWGATQLDWMLEWSISLLVLWLKLKVTKYLLLTLMAPFMSALAASVRKRETGQAIPFSLSQLLRDLLRGVRTAATLLLAELSLTLLLALAGLLLTVFAAPLAVLLSPLLLLIGWAVGAYFYGAAIFDAVYEQAGHDWRSSIRAGWADRYRLLGIGAVFSALIAVPFAGLFLATFLGPMPCTVAAARLTFSPPS